MGTRSLTEVQDDWGGGTLFTLYRQFDGYLSGMGKDLKKWLHGKQIINGIGSETTPTHANGMGCLGAQLIAHFKTGIGEFYMKPPGARDLGEEFVYTIYLIADRSRRRGFGSLGIKVETVYGPQEGLRVLYDGPVEDFDPDAVDKILNEGNE